MCPVDKYVNIDLSTSNDVSSACVVFSIYRRMFPTVRVSFVGLDPDTKYSVLMDIVPVDNKRYRYAYHRSSWLVAGKADPPLPTRYILVNGFNKVMVQFV